MAKHYEDIEPRCVYCVHFYPNKYTCTLLDAPIYDCWEDKHRYFVKRHKEDFLSEEDMKL